MNISKFLYFILSFIVGAYFIIFGIFFLIIPWAARAQTLLVNFVTHNTITVSVFGLAYLLIGVAVIIYVIQNTRHKYYLIRGGQHSIAVDEHLIEQYVNAYWKELLPDHEIPCSISLKKNQINITADLPRAPLGEQRHLLERIETDLTKLFETKLGYQNEYILSISFQDLP